MCNNKDRYDINSNATGGLMAERFNVINNSFFNDDHKIIHGDVINALKEIKDASIDLIYC
jgi:predicted methyltransferase